MTGSRRLAAVVAVLAVAVFSASCSDGSEQTEPVIVEVPRLVTPQRTIGFDPSTGVIRVGILADLSGDGERVARSQLAGAEAFWSAVNASGGIDGRFPVELVVRDTGGSAATAVASYRELRDTVVMFGQLVGTNTTDAVRELLRSDGIVAVPTTRQSRWVFADNLVPIGSSYAVEAISGISYQVGLDGSARVWCVIADGTNEGQDALFGVILASQNLAEVPELVVFDDQGPGDEARIVGESTAAGCERVWLASGSDTSSRVIAASAMADAEYVLGVGSEVVLPFPAEVAGWARDHLIVAIDAPSWGDTSVGARALRDAVARFVPDARPDGWIRSGFASQYVVESLLAGAVADGDLSHGALLDTASSALPIDTGGLASSPDWSVEPATVPESVTIHVVDQVGVDPLGLRVVTAYTSPIVGVIAANL